MRSKSRDGCGRGIGPFRCCTVVCGDALELLKRLPKGSIGSVVTDPPYGTQNLCGGYGMRQLYPRDSNGKRVRRRILNDEDLSMIKGAVPMLYRCLSKDGWMMSFCGARTMLEMADSIRGAGFKSMGEFVWWKGVGLGYGPIRYMHESILVFTKGKPSAEAKCTISVIFAHQATQDAKHRHPHEKPLRVTLRLVKIVNGVVLDPFCGTGAVVVAAKMLGKHFLGFELDSSYVKDARKRLAECSVQSNSSRKDKGAFLYHEMGANE